MLVSCLCVTENRPQFMEWLVWNYTKQTHADRELIVVDSSHDREPLIDAIREANAEKVTVEYMTPGVSIGSKRNRALAAANGDVICWFDDDDWQHPDKLRWIAEMFERHNVHYLGWNRGWFVDIRKRKCIDTWLSESVYANTVAMPRELALTAEFPDQLAEDTLWMHEIWGRNPDVFIMPREKISVLWLQHDHNTIDRSRGHYLVPLDEIVDLVGKKTWGDTDRRMSKLITPPG